MLKGQLLRVFTNEKGNFGNVVPIIVDERNIYSSEERVFFTKHYGYDESVFIDNIENCKVSIYNPQQEVVFAGPPLVGAAWFFREKLGKSIKILHCNATRIFVSYKDMPWIQANPANFPQWNLKQLSSSNEVENISFHEAMNWNHTMIWSWISEREGKIRARTFANDWDIPQAEANGSGSMMLAAILKQSIEVKHGKGSVIYTKFISNEHVALGGRVVKDKIIQL